MSIVNGSFSVTCSNCNHVHDFDANEADFEHTGTDERNMGPEHQYTWETTFDCGECPNEIEIIYDVWEYPGGAFNHANVEVNGATSNGEFVYDFSEEPEPDESEEE